MKATRVRKGPKSRRCRAYHNRTRLYLDESIQAWQAIYRFPLPQFKVLRGTCGELARQVKEYLSMHVSDVPEHQLSFQLIKKGLPDSCPCMSSGMIDQVKSTFKSKPFRVEEEYLEFVKRTVRKLFPKAWDTKYESFCNVATPPLTSVYVPGDCPSAGSRAGGGCLEYLKWSQSEYLDRVLHGIGDIPHPRGKLMIVESGGKPRALTKFNPECLTVKPLHKTIYNRMKNFDWLLVGPPTRERLRRAGFDISKGDIVSGDYKSATDGLSIEVAEVILDTILSTSVSVPENVKEAARQLLRPLLTDKDFPNEEDFFRPLKGQMMGSYLSFPLLCLQNYAAFQYSLRGDSKNIPLLINGDDILFQKTGHFDKWRHVVSKVGFTVEETKTDVSNNFGTINSCLLRWGDEGKLAPVWVARLGMFPRSDYSGNIGHKFHSFLSGCDDSSLRYRAGKEFFLSHIGELRRLAVSPVSLGFRGLLARRLSKKFGLLELPEVEFPVFFKKHGVSYNPEFIMEVDADSLSREEFYFSSLELSSEKWNEGFKREDIAKNCFRYCRDVSSLKKNYDYPSLPSWVYESGDREFSFRSKGLFEKRSNVSSKAFCKPAPMRGKLFSAVVFYSLFYEEVLPCYDSGAA